MQSWNGRCALQRCGLDPEISVGAAAADGPGAAGAAQPCCGPPPRPVAAVEGAGATAPWAPSPTNPSISC